MMTQEQMDQMDREASAQDARELGAANVLRTDVVKVLWHNGWGPRLLGSDDIHSEVQVIGDHNGGYLVQISGQVCIKAEVDPARKFYVFYWKSSWGSRTVPPETWDEEILCTHDEAKAIAAAIGWFIERDVRDILTPEYSEVSEEV